MQNAVWISSIALVLVAFIAQPRWGGLAFLLATMLVPYGVFSNGEVSIRADLILTPLLLGCQLFGISRTTGRISLIPIVWIFAGWLTFIAATTILSGRNVDLIGAYGYVRLVLVMIIYSWIPWRAQDVNRFQFAYVLISIPIGLLSVGQVLDLSFSRPLSNACYAPPGATVMESQAAAEQIGYLYRAVGVFGNVSPAATYFLLTICLTISLFSTPFAHGRKCWLALAIAASLSGGLATLSGTFVGGIAVVMLIALFNTDPARRKNIILAVVGSALLLAIVIQVARSSVSMVDAQLDYQWERVVGGHLLDNRYSTSDGILAEAIEELQYHLFLGLGWTTTEVFSGDSIYFSILFCSGILGSLLFAMGILQLTWASFQQKQSGRWALTWTAVMLVGGLGCTSLILGRLADGWWAMQGMLICQIAANHSQISLTARRFATSRSPVAQVARRLNVRRPAFPIASPTVRHKGSTT